MAGGAAQDFTLAGYAKVLLNVADRIGSAMSDDQAKETKEFVQVVSYAITDALDFTARNGTAAPDLYEKWDEIFLLVNSAESMAVSPRNLADAHREMAAGGGKYSLIYKWDVMAGLWFRLPALPPLPEKDKSHDAH